MAKRVDANQALITRDLRKAGAMVQSLADLGQGVPDLLVGWKGKNWLFEVKDPMQSPNKRRLTPNETAWHALWQTSGQVAVIYTTEDALQIMRYYWTDTEGARR